MATKFHEIGRSRFVYIVINNNGMRELYGKLGLHIQTHTNIYIHIIHTCTYTCIHILTCTYTYILAHAHTYAYIYIHIHAYTCIYIIVHTYTYIYMHIHTCTSYYTYICRGGQT